MADLELIATLLDGLAEVLGGEMSVLKHQVYGEALKPFTDEQVKTAVNAAVRTLKFFPKPVELLELIGGNKEEKAVVAWTTLMNTIKTVGAYQSVVFEDPKISHIVESFGG